MAGAILRRCRQRLAPRSPKPARISTRFWLARTMLTLKASIASPITRGASPIPGCCGRPGTRMQLDLSNSWIIGDRASDLAAGRAASLRGGILVDTGYGQKEREAALELGDRRFAVKISPNLADAIEVPIASVREAEALRPRGRSWPAWRQRGPVRFGGPFQPRHDRPRHRLREAFAAEAEKLRRWLLDAAFPLWWRGWRRSCGRGMARADRFRRLARRPAATLARRGPSGVLLLRSWAAWLAGPLAASSSACAVVVARPIYPQRRHGDRSLEPRCVACRRNVRSL